AVSSAGTRPVAVRGESLLAAPVARAGACGRRARSSPVHGLADATAARSAGLCRRRRGGGGGVRRRRAPRAADPSFGASGGRAPRACAADVAAVVLGYGDAARLETQTRRSARLVTDAHAAFDASRQGGTLVVSANTTPDRLDAAVEALLGQVDQLRRVPIDEA